MKQDDSFTIEILKQLTMMNDSISSVKTDVALIKARQGSVIDEVKSNKAEVDTYCLEDRKMHKWIKTAIIIMAVVEMLILFGAEEYAKEIFKLSVHLI